MRDTRVELIQMATTQDVEANIASALARLDELADSGARPDLVCLPEMFTFRPLGSVPVTEVGIPGGHPLAAELAARARRLNSYLVGTYITEEADGTYANTCRVFNRSGELIGSYRKTHLFDAPGHAESAHVTAGERLCLVEADFATFGLVICYELRFPEIARTLALAGAECLVVPNSWPMDGSGRTPEELRTLLAATAIQNQAYVVHTNQTGRVAGLDLAGGTCVLDPRGHVVADAGGNGEQTVSGALRGAHVDEARAHRHLYAHRRPELYEPSAVARLRG
ncbi:carbon-nitrogen hydrolase family protein [Streptomyces sp. NPDC052042]|uniref:carbon-nitrogen hydrolase family protein n=1 Tax=Streptomyces sp. NPDC052042 TaxID=3365683 RepID=UPI0037D03F59